ncbi:MAG: hypothetical protein ACP5JU_02355 [Minisyncoccia bacterium]
MRRQKQILYGIIFFSIFLIFSFLIYNFLFKPKPSCYDGIKNQGEEGIDCGGPCIPCEVLKLSPLRKSEAKILIYPDNTLDLIASVGNPNDNYGVKKFSYRFLIYGNNDFKQVSGESFILPLEKKYILETNLKMPGFQIRKVDFEISFPIENWKKIEENKVKIDLLNYNIYQNRFECEVVNSSEREYKNIELDFLIVNKDNEIIGALKTYVDSLEPNESKNIVLTLPPLTETPDKVLFFPEVNLFEE